MLATAGLYSSSYAYVGNKGHILPGSLFYEKTLSLGNHGFELAEKQASEVGCYSRFTVYISLDVGVFLWRHAHVMYWYDMPTL